jgi:alanine racemase
VVDTLQEIPHVPGRLNPLPGINDSLLLDDSYNATPLSMIAGLQTLSTIAAGKRIAVLGDMDELGSASEAMHRRVGRCASQSVDVLVTKGNEAAWIADEARSSGLNPSQVIVTYTAQDAISAVIASTEPGSSILVKGSASARLESVVGSLLAEPDLASDVLVRQDRAWRNTVVVRPDRPTWLDIELGAVGHNVRTLRSIAQGRELMVVLKGDAYGHGAAQVAHTALFNGASACAVACVPEGRGLRDAGIEAPILVLGYTPGWQAREAVRLSLVLSVFDMRTAAAYSEAAQALNRSVPVHVKVDTGMHRLGVNYQTAAEFVRTVRGLPNLDVTGIFTHFAMADELTERAIRTTDLQIDRFNSVLADLESTGERPPVAHAANSAALLTRPDALYDMVRPGIAVYGLPPAPDIEISGLIPALSWKSQVAQVHSLGPGEHVGYGHEWSSAGESRIATVPVGYADGFRRGPTTWKHILIRGQRAPVIGRVSMDQIGVDVTHVPSVRTGDQAVLIGTQGSEQLPTTQIAEWLGTSVYEVVAEILARVPRVN